MGRPWHVLSLFTRTRTHARTYVRAYIYRLFRVLIHTTYVLVRVSFGADIYKHCRRARYTEAFIQPELEYVSCATYRRVVGACEIGRAAISREQKVRTRQLAKISRPQEEKSYKSVIHEM